MIHCAAQPSHDWAAQDPFKDFTVNANGTLVLLGNDPKICAWSCFHFHLHQSLWRFAEFSSIGGKRPCWELENHSYAEFGIDEAMSIDLSKHSLFEHRKSLQIYWFRNMGDISVWKLASLGGCLTGTHICTNCMGSGLSRQMRCERKSIHCFWIQGQTGRDNIHSHDLVNINGSSLPESW